MNKFLLFAISLFFASALQAEIHFTDYGDGWVIPLNANQAIDIDEDGTVDFYVNGIDNELGLVPIIFKGCFASNDWSINNLGTQKLQIFEAGERIQINDFNMFNYIDDDRTSVWNTSNGTADDWAHLEEYYIGFAVFTSSSYAYNGWMKVTIDTEAQTFIIKRMAYEDSAPMGQGGIDAGDTGVTTSVASLEALHQVNIAPNPAINFVEMQYEYVGTEELSIVVQDNIGQEVYRTTDQVRGQSTLNIPISNWAQGLYFIRFETSKGIQTKKFSIQR